VIRHLSLAVLASLTLCACGGGASDSGETKATTANEDTPVAAAAISGEASFKKCVACHKLEKGAANGVGPNLHGIVGRGIASAEGFSYSAAMKAKGGVWDEATLDAYIENPRKAITGTKMAFAGISNAEERKALIAYIAAQK
jgi:cytochrome c